MKKMIMVVATMALTCSMAMAEDMIDNPEYKYWSSFKAGSMVKTKMEMSMTGPEGQAMAMTTETTQTLKEVTADKITVEMTVVVNANGQKMPEQKHTREIAAKITAKPADEKDHNLRPDDMKEVGTEDVEIGGKKYSCKIVQIEKTVNNVKTVTKVWQNAEIPGSVAKMTMTMGDPATMSGTMTTVEFKAEK